MKEYGRKTGKMRYEKIDILKGILVLQMIYGHCLQFFADAENSFAVAAIRYVNLTTFSGFMFCFGFVSYRAYFEREFHEAAPRILKNVVRCLMAFYISSMSYVIFVEKMPLRWEYVSEIVCLKRLAGWSEFLLSFALIMLLEFALHPLLKQKNNKILYILFVIALLSVYIAKVPRIPIVASFIDGTDGAFFPIIPYSFYFFIGIYLAQNEYVFRKEVAAAAIFGSLLYVVSFGMNHMEPSRFPLSVQYLLGGLGIVYFYFLLAERISNRRETVIVKWVKSIGRNSLFYLLMSNILIFAITASLFYRKNLSYATCLYAVLLIFIGYMTRICRKIK